MNYSNPQLLEALAQRYVLGTMSFRARRRFSQIIASEEHALSKVLAWEQRLSPLIMSLKEIPPSELLWQRINRDITGRSQPSNAAASETKPTRWQNAAMVLLLIGIGSTTLGWWQALQKPPMTIVQTETNTIPEPASISVISSNDKALWVARIYPQSSRLDIEVQGLPAMQADKDYQLWTLQDNGIPVSLGLLPKLGRVSIALNENIRVALSRSETLAVSLEPLGGSPKDVPTGPVLYTSPLFAPHT
jgi:anti-sigma-K factor RskA